jgi:hypothetical protein
MIQPTANIEKSKCILYQLSFWVEVDIIQRMCVCVF